MMWASASCTTRPLLYGIPRSSHAVPAVTGGRRTPQASGGGGGGEVVGAVGGVGAGVPEGDAPRGEPVEQLVEVGAEGVDRRLDLGVGAVLDLLAQPAPGIGEGAV